MIQGLKDLIKESILLKAFLGLMTLSFGIWGIGDFLRPGADPSIAATVGGTDIPASDLEASFTREFNRFKPTLGGKTGPEAKEMKTSLANGLAQEMSRDLAVDTGAQTLGVVVTDNEVRDTIRGEAAFQDQSGGFSQYRFQQALSANNLTERAFVRELSADLRQQTLIEAAVVNAAPPRALVDPVLSYRTETRVADTLLIATAAVPLQTSPTDADLKKIYDGNIATFTAPEYRQVSALVVRADQIVTPDSLPDDQVKAYYDENIGRYRQKESHQISQLVFESKEKAEAARSLMAPGDHLDDIAQKAKLAPPVDLGALKRDDPLVKTIGSAYDLPVGEISQPVETELGWHLFEVRAVTPEFTQDLATVEPQIRKALAEDKGTDALYDATTTIEDGLAAGSSLDELAKKVNGQVIAIEAIDRDGKDPNGGEVPGLIDKEHFAETAFSTPSGDHSKLMEISKGYYVLKVDAVTPAKPKPFEDVRKQVAAMWEEQTRQDEAADIAARIVKEIGPNTSVADVAAKEKSASFAAIGPVTRFGQAPVKGGAVDSKRLSPELLQKLFAAKVGDVVSATVGDGVIVARLRQVLPTSEETAANSQVQEMLKQSLASDLVSELRTAFVQRYPATFNEKAIDEVASAVR